MLSDQDDLTRGSIKEHLVKLSVPASLGMLFDTLYNLTDNWYAGMISDTALVGLSIASIVFLLLIAISIGLQSGTSAVIAPDFSKKDQPAVKAWISNSIGIGLAMSVLIVGFGLLFSEQLIALLSKSPDVKEQAWEYLFIIVLGNAAYAISAVCAGALIAMGNTTIYRNVLIIGFFANLILNPILTFSLNLGITGLALATLIIKSISAMYLFVALKNRTGLFHWPVFQWQRWRLTLQQVIPSSLNFLTIIIGGFIIVAFIGRFGDSAVAGYSVALRVEQVLLLPAMGLNAAVMALVGQNLGAGNKVRIWESYRQALKLGLWISVICIPLMLFASPMAMRFFSDNPEIIANGTLYLRIDALAFFAYVVIFTCTAVLQAIKKPNFPMVVGIMRQLILPVAINYLLIVMLGYAVSALFWSVVLIVVFSAVLMAWYTNKQLQSLKT